MRPCLLLIAAIILFSAFLLNGQDNYQITYSAAGDEVIEWLTPSTNGNLILAGNTNTLDPSGDGLLIKTDQNGNIIWSKIFGGPGMDAVEKIISCTDGGCIITGYQNSYGVGDYDAWISRFNSDGEILWSDFFGTSMWDGSKSIIQTKDGGFLYVGQDSYFSGAFMLFLNSQGELLLKKEYKASGDEAWFTNAYEKEEGGFYLTGAVSHDGFGIHDSFIIETDETGNFIRGKYYGGSQNDCFRFIIPFEDGFLVAGDTWSWQSHLLAWITKIKPDLSVEKSIVLGDFNTNQFLERIYFANNAIFMAIKLSDKNACIVELNPSLTVKNSWQFKAGVSSYSSLAISTENASVVFAGSSTNDQTNRKDAYLTKFNPEDLTYDCNLVPHTISVLNINLQSSNLSLSEVDNNAEFQHLDIENNDFPMQTQKLCLILPIADFSGPLQVCANHPVTFTNNCQNGQTYHWTFEGGIPATSDSYDPGTIIYHNPGYFSIKLVVTNQAGADSIVRNITVNPIPDSYLGADTTLQEDDETLLLDAGSGMDSYLWQDGSSGQTFEVTEEGMYWVTVEQNSCFSSDTIIVTYGDCLASFYCNDEACIYETVSITNYCKGNESYQWYFEGAVPGSSTSNDPGFIHYEYPGTFMIKLVVTDNGVKDSVIKYIDIYPIPEVFLGQDTIIHMGQSLILDAGPGPDYYLWQDGSSQETFEVFQDGMYWVRVIKNNCVDFDTIFITFDDCIASLEIPNCFTPNGDGFNETFKAECQNLVGFSMLIYNRWGQQLFESEDPEKGWDGMVNGQLCPIGTYFYLIRYATICNSGVDKDGVKKGSVTLLE